MNSKILFDYLTFEDTSVPPKWQILISYKMDEISI